MDSLSDRALVLRVRRGEVEAFGELVRRFQNSVINVCFRLVGERQQAEDMAQESFIRAYDRLGLFDVERLFGPWIRRVAANVCLNDLQRKSSPHLPLDDDHDLPLQSPGTNPEIVYGHMERADRLRAAILSLPPHYRGVAERNSLRRTAWGTVVLCLASLTPFAGWFGVLVYIGWLGLGALILSFFQKSGAIGESYASQH